MQYKKSSLPEPWEGVDYTNEIDQVIPDQSMTLEEILTRFTRGETLPVGMEFADGDEEGDNPLGVDLEKVKNSDLVDKAEFIEKLKDVQRQFDEQEQKKAADKKAAEAKAFAEKDAKRIRMAARKLVAKDSSKKLA